MKITVVGTGYVGLVTGTCFAETGNKVTCVDIDKSKVDKLSNGQITIYEPGLEKIFLRNIKEGRLTFTTELASAIEGAEIIFLALPTPPGADGSADLKYILGVADQLGKILKDYKVIVNKSTVPVGTADKVKAAIAKNYKGEYKRDKLNSEITRYSNFVLLSSVENTTPLVVKEALTCGLGVVVSESVAVELDETQEFIDVIPENKIEDLEYLKSIIEKNKIYSVENREKIREYGVNTFSLDCIIQNEYIPKLKTLLN